MEESVFKKVELSGNCVGDTDAPRIQVELPDLEEDCIAEARAITIPARTSLQRIYPDI